MTNRERLMWIVIGLTIGSAVALIGGGIYRARHCRIQSSFGCPAGFLDTDEPR